MKCKFALFLITSGLLLLLFVVGCWLFSQAISHPVPAPLPEEVAGLPLVRSATGRQAVDELTRLHAKEFPLTSGAVGVYGSEGQVILWVSGTPMAGRMVAAMRDRIAEGNSPFILTHKRQDGKRFVYEMKGMGQEHFYFQSGNLVVWLAADAEVAAQALEQTLGFYP